MTGPRPRPTADRTGVPSGRRVTVFLFAPFDRPIALTALAGASSVLAFWATPTAVQIIGAVIAVVSVFTGGWVVVRELRTPPADRGCEITVSTVGEPARGRSTVSVVPPLFQGVRS